MINEERKIMETHMYVDSEKRKRIETLLKEIRDTKSLDAVNALYEEMNQTIRYIAMKYLRSESEADDMVQSFWADISSIAAGYRYWKNGYGYLCVVMNNRTINWYRRVKRQREHVTYVDPQRLAVFGSGLNAEQSALEADVEKAIDELDETERIIIQETVFERCSVRQVARDLKMSKSVVQRIKTQALAKLRESLEDYGDKNQ